MEFRQLRHFLALADLRNFSRAAKQCNLTQQAFSHSIAQLETKLNVRLFDRSPSGALLTDIGRAFEKRARLICAEMTLANREVEALQGGNKGEITLGVGSALVATVFAPVLARFAAMRPKVTVTMVVDTSRPLYERLMAGSIDLAIAAPMVDIGAYETLVFEPIAKGFVFDGNYLVMRQGHPLMKKNRRCPAELGAQPWVMPFNLSTLPGAVFRWFESQGVPPPTSIVRTDSVWGAKALVMNTDFVALLGRELARPELDAGVVAGFSLPGLDLRFPALLSYRKNSDPPPAALALMGLLRRFKMSPGRASLPSS